MDFRRLSGDLAYEGAWSVTTSDTVNRSRIPREWEVTAETLLALLDGAIFANAIRRNGKPCRIHLPDDPKSRTAIVDAHLRGNPSTLEFQAEGRDPWREKVDPVALSAFCPAADGRCRWLGIDLDAADHGAGGLFDPKKNFFPLDRA
ncbi:MAG: hypothetical protein AABZ47_12775 [Planctomycetota bacterium]